MHAKLVIEVDWSKVCSFFNAMGLRLVEKQKWKFRNTILFGGFDKKQKIISQILLDILSTLAIFRTNV